jgi:hypothetical protein
MPGFVKLVTAADIPPAGRNNFFSPKVDPIPEEVVYLPVNMLLTSSAMLHSS